MKKALKIVGIVLVIGIVFYGARWAYYVNEYKQHLPRTEITVNGVEHEYYLFTPANETDGPSPLLVTLQGGGADAGWRFASQYDWEALAEKEGMIIALPSGKQVGDNEGAWQLNTDSESMQDIDYFEAMISEISSKYTVDASRIYAVGYSLGSMLKKHTHHAYSWRARRHYCLQQYLGLEILGFCRNDARYSEPGAILARKVQLPERERDEQ
jgi:poly(3-hydroxybutyrate) depolymerase